MLQYLDIIIKRNNPAKIIKESVFLYWLLNIAKDVNMYID